jgi:hypothetical protein
MTEQTKMQKFKSWCSDHSEEITLVTVFGGLIAGVVALVIVDTKDQNRRIEEYNAWAKDTNNWLNEQQNSGNAVYQLADSRYLVVPQDAKRELVIK